MKNKYIITLEEIPFERFHSYNVPSERLYRVQGFNSLVFDGNGLSKLTPYTEPNLEAIRKEVYEQGLNDGISKCAGRKLCMTDEYQKAYEDGYAACGKDARKLYKGEKEEAYQKGLSDAWDAARKIFSMDGEVRETLLHNCFFKDVIENISASEAVEKIRQYEQEQEEIKVGDEVNGKGGKGIITRISDDGDHFNVMWENGSTGYYMREDFKKTGRHFPEIAEVLRKMQERE